MALLWLLVLTAVLSIIQGVALGHFSLRRITYNRSLSRERVHAGEQIEMIEVLGNTKRLPVPWLRLEAEFPASFHFQGSAAGRVDTGMVYQQHVSAFSMMPRTRITRRHFITCSGRGIFNFSTAQMVAGDIFGMFTSMRQLELRIPLVVAPRLLEEEEMPVAWNTWQGDFAVRRWILEDPFLIEGAREYAAGDPMNRIHWKATAHTGTLQVYRQGYTADPEVVIFLNVEMEKDSWRELEEAEQMEHAISAAATCVSALIGQGVAVGFGHNAFSSYERQLQPGRGSAHLQDLYKCMAGIRLRTQAPLKTYLQDQNGAHPSRDYIIISVENSPAVKEAIQELEGAGRSVSLIQTGEAPEQKFKEVSGQ